MIVSTVVVWSGAESTGVFDLYVLSLLQITSAGLVAAIVCAQWFLGDKAPKITRALSTIVLALVLAFVVFFAVSSGDVDGGANIGLGLLGMAISYLGFANALAVVIPRLRLAARQ
ncbi:hypothetical protein FRX94_06820 [Corynebacterium canis]|uniref:Uncharacterized protein n=1 Tax=Corynebacterium canis TaxID=679663 RepID=A0A5C5UHE8_9CORY|nr:hypothetical protein [Corynebacterium canis]TWT25516.1 hypothetical protein FRX94_06820 [Corynebacterium canis]